MRAVPRESFPPPPSAQHHPERRPLHLPAARAAPHPLALRRVPHPLLPRRGGHTRRAAAKLREALSPSATPPRRPSLHRTAPTVLSQPRAPPPRLRSCPQLATLYFVPMGKKKNKAARSIKSLKDAEQAVTSDYIGGDSLDELLSKLIRSVEVAKASAGGLPEKIWMKQQFCIGVNDVTRVLERMPAAVASHSDCSSEPSTRGKAFRRAPLVPLQAVLIAADCHPKWLTKHVPTLANTRQVPVLCLKDNKGSSLRLGQVANVRTALAIGIKARDSIINKTIDEVLKGSEAVADEQNISIPSPVA